MQNFFLQSSRFFERLSLIEGKTSDAQPLRKAIVRVFSTQLSICGLVENRTKQKAARFSTSCPSCPAVDTKLTYVQNNG